jgi:hypothetical protein
MRPTSNAGLKTSRTLVAWFLAAALVIALHATGVFAVPDCVPCTCSGLGTCQGCQAAFPPGGILGVWVNITILPTFTYCTPGGTDGCSRQSVICWSVPAGTVTPTFTDGTCANQAGNYVGALEIRRTGCEPGVGGP